MEICPYVSSTTRKICKAGYKRLLGSDARRTSNAGGYLNLCGSGKHLVFDLIPDGLWNDLPLHQLLPGPVRASSNDVAHIGTPNPRQGFEVFRRGRVQILRLTIRLSPPVTEYLLRVEDQSVFDTPAFRHRQQHGAADTRVAVDPDRLSIVSHPFDLRWLHLLGHLLLRRGPCRLREAPSRPWHRPGTTGQSQHDDSEPEGAVMSTHRRRNPPPFAPDESFPSMLARIAQHISRSIDRSQWS